MTDQGSRLKTSSRESSRNRLVRYSAGAYIFRSGELGAEMYVVRDGTVEVIGGSDSERSDSGRVVAVLEKGDFFGEMAILEGLPRSASVRARSDVELVRIDGTTFTQLLRSQPEIAIRIMRKLSRRLRAVESPDGAREESEALGIALSSETSEAGSPPAYLVHEETGTRFPFPECENVLVGRRDPITGIEPHVDLSAVDPGRSCSRQHAKLISRPEGFLLVEDIGTTNGTFLNGDRLEAGVPVEIRAGDELRFGSVVLVFED